VYAYLPEWTGKRLYSDGLAKLHVWISFVAGMGFVTVWLIEGLEGAPRRFSILPEGYEAYQPASIPFIYVLALAQLLFVYNIVQTLRGKGGLVTEPARVVTRRERRRRASLAGVEAAYVLVVIALMFGAGVAGYFIGNSGGGGGGATVTQPTETAPPATTGGGDAAAGAEVFASAGCVQCHTLSAAGATGTVGPNLDQTQLTPEQIVEVVTNGRNAMPALGGQLDEQQILDVAAYIDQSKTG
jgi:mono/diheme cytochrome c family protein